MIVWHECSHTVVAWLMGDPSARFVLVLVTPTQQCIGCNLYDSAALDPARNAVVNLAGVIGTQVLAWGSALALVRLPTRSVVLRVLLIELLALTVLGDLVFQTVQGLAGAVPAAEPLGRSTSYPDADAVVSFAAQATGMPPSTIATLGIVVVALDLIAIAAVLARRRRPAGPSRA